jgi:hypothetical protein
MRRFVPQRNAKRGGKRPADIAAIWHPKSFRTNREHGPGKITRFPLRIGDSHSAVIIIVLELAGRIKRAMRERLSGGYHNQSYFIVRDNNGMALAYVYFETDAGRRTAANLLTRHDARRIAANIAKLPTLPVRPQY